MAKEGEAITQAGAATSSFVCRTVGRDVVSLYFHCLSLAQQTVFRFPDKPSLAMESLYTMPMGRLCSRMTGIFALKTWGHHIKDRINSIS
jgi:hypothetical protein